MRRGTAPSARASSDDWETIGGTQVIVNSLPVGQNICLGGCWNETNNRLVWLNWNSNGNSGGYVYNIDTGVVYTMLLSADVVGGLNFVKRSTIHSCFVINDNFYWVDGTNNEPRRINVDAGIKTYQPGYITTVAPYSTPITASVISWIRRPPGLPLTQTKVTQAGLVNNFIQYGAFEFAARYQYRDYEFSTLSALSTLADYNATGDTFNRIDVTMSLLEHIEQDVQQVDYVVRDYTSGVYFIIRSWNRNIAADAAAIAAHNAGTTALAYSFYNNQTSIALDAAYSVKPFDSVPVYSQTAETAKNRTFMGDNTLGYDTPLAVSSLVATTVPSGSGAVGGIIGPIIETGQITGVTIGGVAVTFVSGTTLPVGEGGIGTYFTGAAGPSETVVISVVGPCVHVRVRYGPGDGTFTNVDQVFTTNGNYTFPAIPINFGTTLTWICTLTDF